MVTRPIKEAQEAAESARETVKNLCPWLESPHKCPDCDRYCDAERDYVESQAMEIRIWRCPQCNQRFYRNRD